MENSFDYKEKYLKYKKKYLLLQELIGSAQQSDQIYTSLIVTHNGRMRCLLDTLGLTDLEINPNSEINPKKKKFMNCAVLKLTIDSTNIDADLIIPGELAAGEGSPDTYFSTLKKTVGNSKIDTFGKKFIFFIVRHGHGKHNLAKDRDAQNFITKKLQFNKAISSLSGSITDAELTNSDDQEKYPDIMKTNGEIQAVKSGEKLGELGQQIGFLFASDLKRTRQTLYKLLEGAYSKNKILGQNVRNVTILPCAHELDYNKNGCDGKQGMTAPENVMNCELSKVKMCTGTEKISNIDYCSSIPLVAKDENPFNLCLDWNFYKTFYDGSRKSRGSNTSQCRITNMIQEAILIILNPNEYKNILKERKEINKQTK